MRAALLLALTCCTSSTAIDDVGASADAAADAGFRKDAEPGDAEEADAPLGEDAALADAVADEDAAPMDATDGGTEPEMLVFAGTGDWGATNGSIVSYRFDGAALVRTGTIAAGDIASFLAFDPVRGIVHVADEGAGRVLSFAIEGETLRYLDERVAQGHPVHATLSASGRHLLVAHYNEGRTEVFEIQPNGAVDDAVDLVTSGAQSHSVRLTPDDLYAFVPAKDADWIAQYTFDGTLTENVPPVVMTAAGAGPRHLDFDPSATHAYVINENDNTVDAYALSGGTLSHLQTISALPAGFTGQATGADIHVHPNGRFLYASERVIGAQGLIAIFSIGPDGLLTPIGHEETRGEIPRNFALTETHLLAANQSSGSIAIFTVDANTGLLTFVDSEDVGAPPFFVGVVER